MPGSVLRCVRQCDNPFAHCRQNTTPPLKSEMHSLLTEHSLHCLWTGGSSVQKCYTIVYADSVINDAFNVAKAVKEVWV